MRNAICGLFNTIHELGIMRYVLYIMLFALLLYDVFLALSSHIIDRIFSGAVTRLKQGGKMSYTDFVAFLLSEEDKKTDKR